MSAARLRAFLFAALFDSPRRIDRGELCLERSTVLVRELLDTSDRTQRTDGGSKQRDTREEQERFLLGWSRHARE